MKGFPALFFFCFGKLSHLKRIFSGNRLYNDDVIKDEFPVIARYHVIMVIQPEQAVYRVCLGGLCCV